MRTWNNITADITTASGRLVLMYLTVLTLVLTCGSSAGVAADEDLPEAEATRARWRQLYAQVAAKWRVEMSGEESQALTLQREPVFHWDSLNDFDGSLFIWTRDGRAEVIGSIFSTSRVGVEGRPVMTEFQNLSDQIVELTHPEAGAIRLNPCPAARSLPGVQANAVVPRVMQKAQARRAAERFSGTMSAAGEEWAFRFLPTPLVEFVEERPDPTLRSRSLFAYVCLLTDPEAFVMIDSEQTSNGLRWMYRPLRFSNKRLQLRLDDELVWDSPAVTTSGESDDGYQFVPGVQVMTLDQLEPVSLP